MTLDQEYFDICSKIAELEKVKDDLHEQIIDQYKKGAKFVYVEVIEADRYDEKNTIKLWLKKEMTVPTKHIPEHDETDSALLKFEANRLDVKVTKTEYRINLTKTDKAG